MLSKGLKQAIVLDFTGNLIVNRMTGRMVVVDCVDLLTERKCHCDGGDGRFGANDESIVRCQLRLMIQKCPTNQLLSARSEFLWFFKLLVECVFLSIDCFALNWIGSSVNECGLVCVWTMRYRLNLRIDRHPVEWNGKNAFFFDALFGFYSYLIANIYWFSKMLDILTRQWGDWEMCVSEELDSMNESRTGNRWG